jgi:hypothetical protein
MEEKNERRRRREVDEQRLKKMRYHEKMKKMKYGLWKLNEDQHDLPGK